MRRSLHNERTLIYFQCVEEHVVFSEKTRTSEEERGGVNEKRWTLLSLQTQTEITITFQSKSPAAHPKGCPFPFTREHHVHSLQVQQFTFSMWQKFSPLYFRTNARVVIVCVWVAQKESQLLYVPAFPYLLISLQTHHSNLTVYNRREHIT